jgi:anthranilate phosphoribosyltransferase
MAISHYLKVIARGTRGARPLSRDQACDLMGQLLDGSVSDLEVGAFCIAMRVKGETPEEMAGFLDAIHARLAPLPASTRPLVVLPSYNGARKLPVLTPLLALLLAREGLPVLVHGTATEDSRIFSQNVLAALDIPELSAIQTIAPGRVAFAPTALLLPGLARLLAVRRTLGVRNSAHSLVKLMNPLAPVGGRALVVGSYTHREYAESMAATFALTGADALLLRGTEGEPVADARRMPQMDGFLTGAQARLEDAQGGPLTALPELPFGADAKTTATLTRAMLKGLLPVPDPIARQVTHTVRWAEKMAADAGPATSAAIPAP